MKVKKPTTKIAAENFLRQTLDGVDVTSFEPTYYPGFLGVRFRYKGNLYRFTPLNMLVEKCENGMLVCDEDACKIGDILEKALV